VPGVRERKDGEGAEQFCGGRERVGAVHAAAGGRRLLPVWEDHQRVHAGIGLGELTPTWLAVGGAGGSVRSATVK